MSVLLGPQEPIPARVRFVVSVEELPERLVLDVVVEVEGLGQVSRRSLLEQPGTECPEQRGLRFGLGIGFVLDRSVRVGIEYGVAFEWGGEGCEPLATRGPGEESRAARTITAGMIPAVGVEGAVGAELSVDVVGMLAVVLVVVVVDHGNACEMGGRTVGDLVDRVIRHVDDPIVRRGTVIRGRVVVGACFGVPFVSGWFILGPAVQLGFGSEHGFELGRDRMLQHGTRPEGWLGRHEGNHRFGQLVHAAPELLVVGLERLALGLERLTDIGQCPCLRLGLLAAVGEDLGRFGLGREPNGLGLVACFVDPLLSPIGLGQLSLRQRFRFGGDPRRLVATRFGERTHLLDDLVGLPPGIGDGQVDGGGRHRKESGGGGRRFLAPKGGQLRLELADLEFQLALTLGGSAGVVVVLSHDFVLSIRAHHGSLVNRPGPRGLESWARIVRAGGDTVFPMGEDDPLWYAAYGSNCLAARFETYLVGGRAEGSSQDESGARDRRPPSDSRPYRFTQGIRFLGRSTKWGGGVAFLDHRHVADGGAAGRLYRITAGQFTDLAAQESRRQRHPIELGGLVVGEVNAIGAGAYDGVLALDPVDGLPVLTLTSPRPIDTQRPTPPSAAYLRTILRGLLEVHHVPAQELIDVLLTAPGVAERWSDEEMLRLVR